MGVESVKEYAEVSVDVPVLGVSRSYHYFVPQEFRGVLQRGSAVVVPFGSRKARGYVLGFPLEPAVEGVKPILGLAGTALLPQALLDLAGDVSRRYLCQMGEVLRCMVPKKRRGTKPLLWVACGKVPSAPSRQARLLEVMARYPAGVDGRLACREARVPREVLLALERKGVVRRFVEEPHLPVVELEPTEAQIEALRWSQGVDEGRASLLFGVTGSGKTYIYAETVARVIDEGRQAIVLVPEIALTTQVVEAFRARFGRGVALLHSRLSAGERYEEWTRIREGKAQVAIGARSAVFAPFSNLGLIVLDEEHETTYKQEESPRYHAREVALMRAKREGAGVLMGSATPSVETYHRALQGQYGLFALESRPSGREMPSVTVVDMREEMKADNRAIFGLVLQEKIRQTLSRGEQVILFLNRRGHSTFMLCRECGMVLRCPSCDVSLTLHSEDRRLRCHYCDHTRPIPQVCPGCGGRYMRAFGAGTQRVEEDARRAFPMARVLRMDTDTTSRKGSHERILGAFRNGEADILVGTQMIAKGLDLANVTLVGAVAADTALHLPDFRSAERTFQLLTQVAGRAGRGDKLGEVIIQTYNPHHYSIECARLHDYAGFYSKEVASRQEVGYPPFRDLAQVVFSAASEETARRGAELLADGIECVGGLEGLGPAPAPIGRIKGRYRWMLVVKAPDRDTLSLGLEGLLERAHGKGWPAGVRVIVDVDPSAVL